MSNERTQQPSPSPNPDERGRSAIPQPAPLTTEQRSAADERLDRAVPQNASLNLPGLQAALNPDLRRSASVRQKLVLAQYLRLVAASLDGRVRELGELRDLNKKAETASNMAVGQMLQRLRPREQLCHQVMTWRANLPDSPASLAKKHTAILIAPSVLDKPVFQKIVNRLLHQTNAVIWHGEYRSFLFLPVEHLQLGAAGLAPYLKMAERFHVHVLGGLSIPDSVDAIERLRSRWQMTRSMVGNEDRETLSHASIVANHIVTRQARKEFFEAADLSIGLEFAYAAQMAKYFQRKRDGHWYVAVRHPHIAPADMRTVNIVSKLPEWKKAVEANLNFAYMVTRDQDTNPGVRIYGATTVFPREGLDLASIGNQVVPFTQSQGRVTKNRINFYLLTQLERFVGGQYSEKEVRDAVERYLSELQTKQQILGWEAEEVKSDGAGNFRIKLRIDWSAQAESFEIDTGIREKRDAAGNE